MKRVDLKKLEHTVKIGDVCGSIEPNITEDSLFYDGDEAIGFYLKNMGSISKKACDFANIANAELLSDRVPKSMMDRKRPLEKGGYLVVSQYSCILGSVAPKPHMRRNYPTKSSVHGCKSAEVFVSAMLALCRESEEILKQITPHIFARQAELIQSVPEEWRFGRLFTSSISNFNISAPFHRDAANIEGCVNIIIAKKWRAEGGNLTVPDYGATVDSCDNSMLVYPAWRNVHGVTPITPKFANGYRNSLIFYPLKAFSKVTTLDSGG